MSLGDAEHSLVDLTNFCKQGLFPVEILPPNCTSFLSHIVCMVECGIYRWLELKSMLVRKNRKVAMKSKRRWRKFWGEVNSRRKEIIGERTKFSLQQCL